MLRARKKPLYSELGEMMFTHFGLTGPEILSASAYIDDPKTRKYYITIDMKPALSAEKLDQRIMRDFAKIQQPRLHKFALRSAA